ncbi:MAG: sugar phosphate nucleotidyltransferase [bacterium]|nr:sugar phosphate nucleotidyltransferase [bacterium]
MRVPKILAIVLAGGKGSRLGALTENHAKPALPIAGTYRLIDISLSNLMHSHISNVWLVEQHMPHSLNIHLSQGRPWDLDRNHGGLEIVAPFEGGTGAGFATGNADTLYRLRERLAASGAEFVLVLSADHLYTLNFLDVVSTHRDTQAELTMVTTKVAEDASRYGVVQASESGRVTGFDYKPDDPEGHLVTAEIFLYTLEVLVEALETLGQEHGELSDYGDELVPWFVERGRTYEHRLTGYWMDLGTLQSYWTAHLQLLDGDGATLDDPEWAIFSAQPQLLPARIEGSARVSNSLVSAGTHVAGEVRHSVVGPGAVIEEGATVADSVILNGARIASGVHLTNCIVAMDADVSRAGERGSAGSVTLIDETGRVAERQKLDPSARLPLGFS